jgi:hypothetical protein
MSEKVLFEIRVEEDKDGYNVVFNHDKDAIAEWCPSIRDRFNKRVMRHFRKPHMLSRHQTRRRLDFYEGMYKDIYGNKEKDEKK